MLVECVGSQSIACSLAKQWSQATLVVSMCHNVPSEVVAVRGYAYSGGGRNIIRVDVSADNGQTWHVATIDNPDQLPFR